MYSDRSESKVVKSRSVFLLETYLNFDAARDALISGKMSWARTTPEMWREFLEILAADLGKLSKDLNYKDFSSEKSPSLGGKLLDGLIDYIERKFGFDTEEAIWFVKKQSGIAHTEMLFFTGEKAARLELQLALTREEEWQLFSEKRVPWELTRSDFHRHLLARQALKLKKDPFDLTLKDLAKRGLPDWERNLMTLVHHYAKQTEEFRALLCRELGLILKKDAALVTENELKGIGVPDPSRTLVRLYRHCAHKQNAVKAGFKLLMQTVGFSEAAGQQRFNFDRVELPKVQAHPKPIKPKTTFKLSDQISVEELQRRVKPTASVIEARRYVDAKGQTRINFRVRTPVYKYPKGKLFNFGPTPKVKRVAVDLAEIKLDAPGQQYLDFRVRKQVYPKGRLFRGIGRIANREERVEEQKQVAVCKDPRQGLLDFSSSKKIKPKDKGQRQVADAAVKPDTLQNTPPSVSQPVLHVPTKIFLRDAIKQILSEQSHPISLKKITRLLKRDSQFSKLSKSQVKRVIKADQELKADARIKRKVKRVEDLNTVDLILDQEIVRVQQKFGDTNLRRPGISAPLELADFEKLWARGASLSSREKVFAARWFILVRCC